MAQKSPSPTFLHAEVKRIVDLLDGRLGIQIPEMNAAPVLWRLTSCLGGTREFKLIRRRAPETYGWDVSQAGAYTAAYKVLQLTESTITLASPGDAESLDIDIESEADEALDVLSLGGDFQVRNKRRRSRALAGPPEVAILSAILIAFKLMYGLDGGTR